MEARIELINVSHGIYSVAILYIVTLSAAAHLNKSSVADFLSKCPKNNPRNKTVLILHKSDCTKFYNCYMGKKEDPVKCPIMDKNGNRLHFNPKLQICDWPWQAGCQILSSTPTFNANNPVTKYYDANHTDTDYSKATNPVTKYPNNSLIEFLCFRWQNTFASP
ncbi:uncharacterized protein LOC118647449 [Monomorium pharaonis]|uniref:uncharacterized protein LOC118647449 n=1 Tax=Monomorium pharaonis TaxID=307658 RepID=UPI0017470AB1|nr:uncharacterized protein LOC118647449 [Monomorium pharaonis]